MANSTVTQAPPTARPRRAKGKRRRLLRFAAMLATIVFAVGIGFAIWLFLLPSGQQFKTMMADTLISTQHRHWAKYLIGQEALDKRVDSYAEQFEQYAEAPVVEVPVLEPPKPEVVKPLYEIEPIEGKGYKGYLLSISDPKKLRIGVPGKYGKGEKVSSMVQRTGALIGVNGGGFIDPEWMGNGFQPSGIVMSGGTIYYLDAAKTTPLHIVGIDRDGRMIAGKYSPNELLQMGVTEAVTFSPRFIVNGVGQIKNPADGWGIAPRTCMAQTADGTILFAIIDGRQPGHSIGATLYDVQQLFLERGAILAANLDGGSSTVLVKEGTIVNKPASEYGERYLPTAWLLFDKPEEANIRNIWEGVDISKIDPSKW